MALHRPVLAPKSVRPDGVVTYLLASPRTDRATLLTTSLVELRPGARQRLRHNPREQVYFVLHGDGVMTLGAEALAVEPGDCVFIPPGIAHSLANVGGATLAFFAAAAPAFLTGDFRDSGPPRGGPFVGNGCRSGGNGR